MIFSGLGETPEGGWFDVSRVTTRNVRVMRPPSAWMTDKGPAEKPAPARLPA